MQDLSWTGGGMVFFFLEDGTGILDGHGMNNIQQQTQHLRSGVRWARFSLLRFRGTYHLQKGKGGWRQMIGN